MTEMTPKELADLERHARTAGNIRATRALDLIAEVRRLRAFPVITGDRPGAGFSDERSRRVAKFCLEWRKLRDRDDDIYNLHLGDEDREAVLLVDDLQWLIAEAEKARDAWSAGYDAGARGLHE